MAELSFVSDIVPDVEIFPGGHLRLGWLDEKAYSEFKFPLRGSRQISPLSLSRPHTSTVDGQQLEKGDELPRVRVEVQKFSLKKSVFPLKNHVLRVLIL